MKPFLLDTKERVEKEIRWHVEKILIPQDEEGMIPSYIEIFNRRVEVKKDIPRQAMATMALLFAQRLIPSLKIEKQIVLSEQYIYNNTPAETDIHKIYIHLYLALSQVYAGKNPYHHIDELHKYLSPEFLGNPIAVSLYLRLSSLLPAPLPESVYITEIQRYKLSLVPRKGRFFDYTDTLIWAKKTESTLAQNEYMYLLSHKTSDNWFADMYTNTRMTASVVGKLFEVFTYYDHDVDLIQKLYTNLMGQKVSSQYAKDSFNKYVDYVVSDPSTLRIDDVHMHILVGLCYQYQKQL